MHLNMSSQWQPLGVRQRFSLFFYGQGNENPGHGKYLLRILNQEWNPELWLQLTVLFTAWDFLYSLGISSLGLQSLTFWGISTLFEPRYWGCSPYHLACLPANLKLQAPVCRAEISQGLAGHWELYRALGWPTGASLVFLLQLTFPSLKVCKSTPFDGKTK